MTVDDVFWELDQIEPNDQKAAVDLYRRAIRAGVAFAGLTTTMARVQDDPTALLAQFARVDREESPHTPTLPARLTRPSTI